MNENYNPTMASLLFQQRILKVVAWTVPKYRSNRRVYTSSYKRHRTVQYEDSGVSRAQLATRHSREHTLSAVGPDAQVE